MANSDALPSRLTAALADRYRVERELGAGGMATVFLANDLKHHRKVAIKVLKPDLAAVLGAERFVQEIRTTASLQHPHILALFDSGEADGFLYYVMPYLEGETIREKLNRETQLGIGEALRITTEVADALDYAHRHGVIHRDIKPENVLLHDGRAMVMDFGIALAVSAAAGGRMTETGLSLGTPHYMSPEQATADKDLTPRSDVYSLAAVLYEMLAGDPPHTGASAQQIIMKIVTEEAAPVTAVRRSVAPHIAAALAQALEKLPADRFESARAFAEALANPAFGRGAGRRVTTGERPRPRWVAAAAAVGLTAVGLVVGWAITRPRTGGGARDIGLPPDAPMQVADWYRGFAVAPDGSFVVYEARTGTGRSLWYRRLDGIDAKPVPGTEGAFGTPRISPDGKRVAFAVGGEIKVADLVSGNVSSVGRASTPLGGSWLADGAIFFGDNDGRLLRWIGPEGGPGRQVDVQYCILPQSVGTANRVLCGGGADKYANVRDLAHPMEKQAVRRAAGAGPASLVLGSDFRIVADRYLVYLAIDGTLMATRIEHLDSLTVGRSVPLVPMVHRNAYSGAGQFDLTRDGALVYAPGINAEVGRLMRVGADGRTAPLGLPEAAHLRFAPSPDGRRMATVVEGIEGQELRVWSLADGSHEAIDRGFFIGAPAWSPDGGRLVYRKADDPDEGALIMRRLDSPDSPRVLARGTGMSQPSSYLSDDSLLVGSVTEGTQLMLIDPTTEPPTIDPLGFASFFSSISPDRRWIAIQRLGTVGIELRPWPARDRRWLVDAAGFEPRWRSASELAFQVSGTGGIFQVTIGRSAGSPVGKREAIVEDSRFADTPGWSLAFMPNGDLVYLQSPAETLGHYLRVVPGWVGQMKRMVDAANR